MRVLADTPFVFSVALPATLSNRVVELVSLYSFDGVDISTIEFPLELDEGAPGSYATQIEIPNEGVFFADVNLDGTHLLTEIIRVVPDHLIVDDANTGTSVSVPAVSAVSTETLSITISDREGRASGEDENGDAISWPQAMAQVEGHPNSWYFEPVVFSEAGAYNVALAGDSGPVQNSVLRIAGDLQASVTHFEGWQPDAPYDPADWVSIAFLRRWTGWSTSEVSDQQLKELRRLAIETFITETNRWYPRWRGTMHTLEPHGDRLYLPVPILTPQNGGMTPVIETVERDGSQDVVEVIDNADVIYMTTGHNAKQPFLMLHSSVWRGHYFVRIRADWGEFIPGRSSIPEKVKQVVVGLVRWHSLSYGQGPDGARDQATANRITSESTRDYNASFHELAIGRGITGDATVDRELARMRIDRPPKAFKS